MYQEGGLTNRERSISEMWAHRLLIIIEMRLIIKLIINRLITIMHRAFGLFTCDGFLAAGTEGAS